MDQVRCSLGIQKIVIKSSLISLIIPMTTTINGLGDNKNYPRKQGASASCGPNFKIFVCPGLLSSDASYEKFPENI
jgi:hypothetical protein